MLCSTGKGKWPQYWPSVCESKGKFLLIDIPFFAVKTIECWELERESKSGKDRLLLTNYIESPQMTQFFTAYVAWVPMWLPYFWTNFSLWIQRLFLPFSQLQPLVLCWSWPLRCRPVVIPVRWNCWMSNTKTVPMSSTNTIGSRYLYIYIYIYIYIPLLIYADV